MENKMTELCCYRWLNLFFFFSVILLSGVGLLHGRVARERAGALHKWQLWRNYTLKRGCSPNGGGGSLSYRRCHFFSILLLHVETQPRLWCSCGGGNVQADRGAWWSHDLNEETAQRRMFWNLMLCLSSYFLHLGHLTATYFNDGGIKYPQIPTTSKFKCKHLQTDGRV